MENAPKNKFKTFQNRDSQIRASHGFISAYVRLKTNNSNKVF